MKIPDPRNFHICTARASFYFLPIDDSSPPVLNNFPIKARYDLKTVLDGLAVEALSIKTLADAIMK